MSISIVHLESRCALRLVGPLFFEKTANSKSYCSKLHDFISELEEDEIAYSWFQKDGTIAHTANNYIKLLNEIFGERVISSPLLAGSYCTGILSVGSSKVCSVS
jgi:hypothetical protein